MKNSNIELSDTQRVKFLINVVSEKLSDEDLEFEDTLVSDWDDFIEDNLLSKLSLSRDDLKSEVENGVILKELANKYIEENPDDAENIISGMNQFAGDGLTELMTVGQLLIIYSVLSGVSFKLNNKNKKINFDLEYKQSQKTINQIIEFFSKSN